jgi:hypothetical protein
VELTRTPSRFDAEAIVRELQLHDVRATVFGGDADGTAPHYGALQGHRVMIRVADVQRATIALSRPS